MAGNTPTQGQALTPEEYAAQFYAANPKDDQTGLDTAVKDPEAVLSPVSPQFEDPADAPEGVDAASLPSFKDARRMLPADRLRAQAGMAKLAVSVPDKFRQAAEDGSVTLDLDLSDLTGEDLDAISEMVTMAQDTVLGAAEDRDAMTEWLVAQESPVEAVMYAFSRYQEALGN